MEPQPEPDTSSTGSSDMRAWSIEEVARWVVYTLKLPPDGERAHQLREEFEEEELDGRELLNKMSGTARRLHKLLKGLQLPDPIEATQRLLQASELLRAESSSTGSLLGSVSAPHEAPTPLSERWSAVLASAGPDQTRFLQGLLDVWHPQRWVIDEQERERGSSGVVYRCTDRRLGEVAIKFAHSDEPHKLEREVALMQRVAHEHVCRLIEYHKSEDGRLFGMVLELLENGSLAKRIKHAADGRLCEFEVVSMAFDMLSALKYVKYLPGYCSVVDGLTSFISRILLTRGFGDRCMHGKGVIHRDIKPANIMLTEVEGRKVYKLIDFSISAVERECREDVSQTLRTGTTTMEALAGTPHFMSPEQVQERTVITRQTDLWSMGVVMFQALSGRLPFAPEESDRMKILYAIVNEPPAQLSDVIAEVGGVSDSISDFTNRCLQKSLSQRFGSAEAMEAALWSVTESSGDEKYGLFISYRVRCDKGFAEALYRHASRCELRPGRENRLQVYLDKVRIMGGQSYDENFVKGMANSTVFSPLLSVKCLRGLVEIGESDEEDFVLIEWIVAVELQKRQVIKALYPITIEMQDRDIKDGQTDALPGLYSQSFFEQLRDGKIRGKLEGGKVVEGGDTDLVELPDVVSAKSTTKARSFLQMLDPPVELSEELTIKQVVMRLLSFQAVLLHTENNKLNSLESVKLARIDSAHGNRAKAIAQEHAAQTCAERIVQMISSTLSGQGTQPWAAMDEANVKIVDVEKDSEPRLWACVASRIAESLPDFDLELIQRVQNKTLWRKYSTFKKQLADQHEVDERELFHYAKSDTLKKVVMSKTVGFDPRLGGGEHGGGEYGAGTYFAQHAIYPVAYGCGWLDGDAKVELSAEPAVTLLLAKVALGRCKDFGARCRSGRGDAAAVEAGMARGLKDDWGAAVGRHGAAGFNRPPPYLEGQHDELYDSVTGTEGNLQWSRNHRLRASGHEFGRQYVTFETAQAYPELLLHLRRRPERDLQLRWEMRLKTTELAEQHKGAQDSQMRVGTRVHIEGHGEGTYVRMEEAWVGANTHWVELNDSLLLRVQLKEGPIPWHVSALGPGHMVELAQEFLDTLEAAQAAALLGMRMLPAASLDVFTRAIKEAGVTKRCKAPGFSLQGHPLAEYNGVYHKVGEQARGYPMFKNRAGRYSFHVGWPHDEWCLCKEDTPAVGAVAATIQCVKGALPAGPQIWSVLLEGQDSALRVDISLVVTVLVRFTSPLQPFANCSPFRSIGSLVWLMLQATELEMAEVEQHWQTLSSELEAAAPARVVEVLRQAAENEEIQVAGCKRLFQLHRDDELSSQASAAAGSIEAVLRSMAAHVWSARVQEQGCDVLAHAALDVLDREAYAAGTTDKPWGQDTKVSGGDERRAKIVAAGGTEVVLRAMWAHRGCAQVVQSACHALWALSSSYDDSVREAISSAGGIEAIVHMMGAHSGCEAVFKRCCIVLSNLATASDRRSAAIAAAGGIEAVVRGMGAHVDSEDLQQNCAGALWNLAASEAHRGPVVAAGGIDALVTAMRSHGGDAEVQQNCAGALRHLRE